MTRRGRMVVSLGGNALLRRGEPADARIQIARVTAAARALAGVAREYELLITHGNGPQVGLLALQAEAYRDVAPYPLDVLGAESEGMVGYLLDRALRNELPDREVAALVTQVLVDPEDPAFERPTKPIGPVYREADVRGLAAERGWTVARDGTGVRRVVASPKPLEIVELEPIRLLVSQGVIVICGGGGGVPVVRRNGWLDGIEGVIDKDLFASLLAVSVEADGLVLLTDVAAVERDWGTLRAQPIAYARPPELRAITFAQGSMGPKIEAACRFVEQTGGRASIGALDDAPAVIRGLAGTVIRRGQTAPTIGVAPDSLQPAAVQA